MTKPAAMKTISTIFNFFGGVGGVLAIALVIWRGGAIEERVNTTVQEVDYIKQHGSSQLMAHIQADEQRDMELSRRMTDQENSIRQYGELKVEIRVLATKMDAITEHLKGMDESASANAKAAESAAQAARVAAAAVEKMLENRKP